MMNAVGGTTLHYWAQSWRLNPWDFRVASETRRRYGAARLPPGTTVEDWPFGLEELEPYYDKVEVEIGVSARPATSRARSTAAATSSRVRARAATRCRRCTAPASQT
jgi:gluconate 2-dehydrogenase alpha chain